ncbi:MAG: phenylalanine 4-monooxygenase [Chitinophagales bacterium]
MSNKPTVQIYSNYTPEDFLVWETLFNRQMNTLQQHAAGAFLKAVDDVNFTSSKIPDFIETNELLERQTGWHILTVPGLCPPADFFQFLGAKKFTATCWLRTLAQLDYIEEPDMFHDVFGHIPLLTNTEYCAFFQQLGQLAVQHAHNQHVIDQIERLYWFTIEFGLMQERGELKIYGAGIISSKGETANALGNGSTKTAFDLNRVINHNFRNDVIQNEYFVIDSFQQLTEALKEFEQLVEEKAETKRA